jgi:hypothetical protein
VSECRKCGEDVPDGKLGMHHRIVHTPPLVILSDGDDL